MITRSVAGFTYWWRRWSHQQS